MLSVVVLSMLWHGMVTAALDAENQAIEISIPRVDWALQMVPGKLSILESKIVPAYRGRKLVFRDKDDDTLISAYILPARKVQSAVEYRDRSLQNQKKLPFALSDIRTYERNGMAYIEYMVNEVEGRQINQKNVFVYMARDGYAIDAHVSKVDYSEDDAAKLNALVESIRIIDNYNHDSLSNFSFASYFYKYRDYRNAAVYYNKALKQEEQRRHLSETEWLVMVDNLGMSLGLSGELERAREAFRYGLSKQPEYPLFYYNLACADAESGDLDAALVNLDKFHQYRANMIPGEQLPDPASDASFARYHGDPRFLATLEKWQE